MYNSVLPQGVVELLDRENDWLEMSQEDARVICFTFFERSLKKIQMKTNILLHHCPFR